MSVPHSYHPQSLRRLAQHFSGRGPVVLIVLDGWGIGDGSSGDAIACARKPNLDALVATMPTTTLFAHGHYVGLPAPNDIGGSEVGHLTMGAGRVFPQGSARIAEALREGSFFRREAAQRVFQHCLEHRTPLHLIGLLSDGNVHSHISHFQAFIEEAVQRGLPRLYVHALLDGRDVPYQSALHYVEPLEARLTEICAQHTGWDYAIASGGGRETITMDRDQNWDKIRLGWQTHIRGEGERFPSATAAVCALRARAPTLSDQYLPPFVVTRTETPPGRIEDDHAVVFMNFRGDRAIEFSQAMTCEDFDGFPRGKLPRVLYVGMSIYDEDTHLPALSLMPSVRVKNPLGEHLLRLKIPQFRLAETQKYAHVTFFFNGGRREVLDPAQELYHLIPSMRLDDFAAAPQMRAPQIGAEAARLLRSGAHRFGLINFANADMVGHSGNRHATTQAVEAVDAALAPILDALREQDGIALITADHGNADEMILRNPQSGAEEPSTKHSLNPVPALLFDPRYRGEYHLLPNNPAQPHTLAQIAATCLLALAQVPPDTIAPPLFNLSKTP